MSNPKVSIIIPVYNVEKYLRQCLDSAINQTLKDIEIICIDDESPDNCPAILDDYAKNDSRIKVIHQKNQGTGAARNNGLDIAQGKYIMFLDSDDWYEPDACEKAYNQIEKYGNDFALFDFYCYENETGVKNPEKWRLENFTKDCGDVNHIKLYNLKTSFFGGAGEPVYKIYSRNFLNKNNVRFTNTVFFEDFPFFVKAAVSARDVSVMETPLYNYRIHNKSACFNPKNYKQLFYNRNICLDIIMNYEHKDKFLFSYMPACIRSFFWYYDKFTAISPAIKPFFYIKMRKHFIKLSKIYDISSISHLIDYKRFKKVLKRTYPEIFMRELAKNTFSTGREYNKKKVYRVITVLGIKIKFRDTQKELIRRLETIDNKIDNLTKMDDRIFLENSYNCSLKRLKNKTSPIKVLFLVSELAKWKNQTLYDAMAKSDKFEPVMALTAVFSDSAAEKAEGVMELKAYCDSKNINYVEAYDIENGKAADLINFNPDVVFFQQPWGLFREQKPDKVSKYALPCYVPYFTPNYGTLSLDCGLDFHKKLFRHYVLNEEWANIYRNYIDSTYSGQIAAVGSPFLTNIKTASLNDYENACVIYAPHYSVSSGNLTHYSTFIHNGVEILNYAQKHPEINWVFKPHPRLKHELTSFGWTQEKINNYWAQWGRLGKVCEDNDYIELFNNSKCLITDCGSFLTEYFVTGKPVIHLISSSNTAIPQPPSEKIFNTFYKVHNLEEMYETFENVIIKNNDTKKSDRLNVAKEQQLIGQNAAQNIINDLLEAINGVR